MCAKISGDRGINFSGQFSIDEILKNQQKVIQGFTDLKKAAELANPTGGSPALRQQNLAAQQVLRDSRLETERLKQEQIQLERQQAETGVATADLTRRFHANRLAQQELRIATQQARTSQAAANGSYREAQQRLTALGNEIRRATGGFDGLGGVQRARIAEYRQLNAQLTEFDRRLGNNQRNVGNYRSSLNGIGSNLAGLAAGYLSAFTALAGVGKVIRTNAELSDSFADVQRTAGLTGIEVNDLSEQLKKIDTRTSLKGLFDIAIVGGQLGIAKDQLSGFTKAVDELAVTLSGELKGGAEGIAKSLGVLDNVFKVTASNSGDVEKSYNQIGSAILKLGQSGLATGDFLADFGERVGGVAKQAGISLPVILSFGAVLQENGVSAEVAGTAFKRLISAISSNSGKFFQVAKFADANLTLKEFNRLVNTDTKGALDLFFRGINQGGSSTIAFNSILKSLKISGAGASQVVSALANNTQALEGHVKEATKAFDEATVSAEQFEIKNNTLAGSIDKLGKAFENSTNSGAIAGFFKPIIDFITEGIKGLDLLASKLKGTQADADNKLVAANQGKFVIPSDDPKERAELEAARERVRKRNVDALKDEVKAVAASTADILAAGKSEIELRKLITGEIYKQGEAQKRLNNNLKFITDPKNVGSALDAQIGKTNKLRLAYARQIQLVEQLRSKLPKAEAAVRSNAEAPNLGATNKNEQSRLNAELNARNELQRKIDEINKNAVRKQISADDAELESVSDKYRKIEFEIEKFNRRNKSGLKITTSGLASSEQIERQAVIDKQSNARLKDRLADDLKLYQEFDSLREKFGLESAKKQFEQQGVFIQNRFDSEVEFLRKLEERQGELSLVDPSKATEAQRQELEIVTKGINDITDYRKKKDSEVLQSALANTTSLYDQALRLTIEYESAKLALEKSGNATPERLGILAEEFRLRKQALSKADAEQKIGYTRLLEDLDGLTREKAIESLNKAKEDYKKQFDAGKLTAKDYYDAVADIENKVSGLRRSNIFNSIQNSIKDYKDAKKAFEKSGSVADENKVLETRAKMYSTIGDRAEQAAQAIAGIGDILGKLGASEETQNTLNQITGLLSGAATLAKGIASGDVASIITGAVGLITSAIDLFNFKDKRIAKQIKQYQADLTSLGKSYADLERQVSRSVGNDIYTNQQGQIANLTQQQEKLIAIRDAESQKKKKDQGRIDDLNNQIDGIPNKIQDIQDSISQNLIQGTFRELSNSLADALTNAFKSGEDGIDAMNASFEDFIANAVKNSLKLTLLDGITSDFTAQLTKYAQENNNSVLGFDFESFRKRFEKAGEEFNKGLEDSGFFKDTNSSGKANTLQGSIQDSLTEETGSIIAGAFNGARLSLLNIEGLLRPMVAVNANLANLAQQNLNQITMMQLNTLRTANNTDSLTYRLENLEELTGIVAKNTGDTLGIQLRAAGRG